MEIQIGSDMTLTDPAFDFPAGFALVWERNEFDGLWYTKVIPAWAFDEAKHKRYGG